jgi:hypothetical protein
MAQIFFMFDKGLMGKFLKLTTGCSAYHTGFLADGCIYDISPKGSRKFRALSYLEGKTYTLVETPVYLPTSYLESLVCQEEPYGYLDYIGFLFRTFNLKARDMYGQICSEKVLEDLYANGWRPDGWKPGNSPPSPCELLRMLNGSRYHN